MICKRHHTLCIYSYVSEHLDCFHVVAIVNTAAVDVDMQLLVSVPALSTSGHIFKGGIAASHGNCVFKFLRNCHTCWPTTAVPFCIQAQYNKDASFSTSSPGPLFSLLIVAVLVDSRCWWCHLKSRNWGLFACECSIVSTSAIEETILFLLYCLWVFIKKSDDCMCVGLFLDSVLSLNFDQPS